jgi:deazaflavin-dependent oxidoreductase (nitroreductase family)
VFIGRSLAQDFRAPACVPQFSLVPPALARRGPWNGGCTKRRREAAMSYDQELAQRPGALKRWLYGGGRPGRLAAFLNRCFAIAGSAGLWPSRLATLEVRGRRTGRVISFPVVIADYQGERYLVSMLGEDASWVKNVRAADGRVVLRHGRCEAVRLEEVDARERAPILRRYLDVAPGARPHVAVDRRAPLADLERVAPHHPVFRIRAAPA